MRRFTAILAAVLAALALGRLAANPLFLLAGGTPSAPPSGDLYSDTFTYSNGSLGGQGSWTLGVNEFSVTSNAAHAANESGSVCMAYHSGTLNANQYSWIQIETGSHSIVGTGVRYTTADNSGYAIQWDQIAATVTIFTFQGAGVQGEATATSKTYSTGHRLRIEVTGTGSAIRLNGYEDTGSGWVAITGLTNIDPTGTLTINSGTGCVTGQLNDLPASTSVKATAWAAGNL